MRNLGLVISSVLFMDVKNKKNIHHGQKQDINQKL